MVQNSDVPANIEGAEKGLKKAFDLCVSKARANIKRLADEPKSAAWAVDGQYFDFKEGFYEIGTQTEERRSLWGLLDLGTNTAQIIVPVTCRYHVQLREAWKFETPGDRVIVHAPALRAAVPPAIHTEELQRLAGGDRNVVHKSKLGIGRCLYVSLTRYSKIKFQGFCRDSE
jgi:hypothetical protein